MKMKMLCPLAVVFASLICGQAQQRGELNNTSLHSSTDKTE